MIDGRPVVALESSVFAQGLPSPENREAARSMVAAATYGKVVGVGYGLLTILGLIPAAKLWTLFGFVPLYGHDVWLHALLAAVATYYGFAPREKVTVEQTFEHG